MLILLYTKYKPGVGKLVQQKSRLQKIKNQRAAKPVSSANTNTVKDASFTLNNVQYLSLS